MTTKEKWIKLEPGTTRIHEGKIISKDGIHTVNYISKKPILTWVFTETRVENKITNDLVLDPFVDDPFSQSLSIPDCIPLEENVDNTTIFESDDWFFQFVAERRNSPQ
jgi:hypothetical protein